MLISADMFAGVRIRYHSNVLMCNHYSTQQKNLDAAQEALAILEGTTVSDLFGSYDKYVETPFESEGGTIEFYRTTG